ncbi:hypothetical protein FLONG3_3699 [Fusarium longipes]|uniref:Uncharacterized protein n=1 Tax=Fusarium longipes TaxID=694270 RepID=A0A395T0L5_9HYPO|nr:hypothetical protein FLONG3_3699 [Fusarium longipes]
MPFSITDLTRKDETAKKDKDLGAFTKPAGYATILFFPITIWQSLRNNKKTIKEVTEARQQVSARIDEENFYIAQKRMEELQKSDAESNGPGPQGSPREKKVPEVEPLDPKLERDPENPRNCDDTCGNALMSYCPIHDRKQSSRPTSPGLLAI